MTTAAAELASKIEALTKALGESTSELPQSNGTEDTELFKSNDEAPPKKSRVLARLQDLSKNSDKSKQEDSKSSEVSKQPQEVRKRSRSRWTDDDYRLRGYPTPAERAASPRKRLAADVQPATLAKLRTLAIESGSTMGDVLDSLLGAD
jgi:hypothetical protein